MMSPALPPRPTPPPTAQDTPTRARKRATLRSKTGCWTCRLKKVKCDEAQPQCQRCRRLRRLCDYGPGPGSRTESPGSLVKVSAAASNPGEMTLQLLTFSSSSSSLHLTATDHEAIRYFRTTFARMRHTKNPDYSNYSIIFHIAEREPLVMHTVLALGARGLEFRRSQNLHRVGGVIRHQNWSYLSHYAAALKHLTAELAKDDEGNDAFSLDACCTALYLMLIYEQNHGDGDRLGLTHHLNGAAMILHHRGRHIRTEMERQKLTTPSALSIRRAPFRLSLYSARILTWIAQCDSMASTFGVGGAYNQALHEILGAADPQTVERLHSFSNPLFRTMWKGSYPQSELTDDIENRSTLAMSVSCFQARYAISLLARAREDAERKRHILRSKTIIQNIAVKYREELEIADGLLPSTDNSHRLVANLRWVAPHYHAVVILFARLAGVAVSEFGRVEPDAHMASIMNLARQAYRHQAHEAVVRIAWPLLVVALETREQQDRDWIQARFSFMGGLNKNLEWADEFLRSYSAEPGASSPWTDPGTWFRSNDGNLFVI